MIKQISIKTPVFPLFSLIACVTTFVSGLLMVRDVWFFLFLPTLIVINIMFGYGPTLIRIVPPFLLVSLFVGLLSLPFASAHEALQTGSRVFLLGISAVPTISMAAIDLVRVLNRIRCPRWLTLGLMIGIRFTGIMATEMRRIRQAMRLRGANTSWYNPKVIYRAFIIPLMMRIISISDLLSLSLETRAFSMEGEVTSYKDIYIQDRDVIYLSLVVLASMAGIILTWTGR